ncbi:MAG: hypothetical protein E8F57_01520 [Methylophaga nitratireducenticrescens]|nr:MAG: hypothetical protein E8F57_01520 [Methylophaga nitratireducenticrescens]
MNDAGFYDDRYLGQPSDKAGINTSTLLLVGLFHLAIAGLLLNSWTQAAQQEEPKLSTIKIQMLQLPKPAPPEIKPVEPVPEPIQPMVEPTPVVQKQPEPIPVVENELAFKRVEEKPKPKQVKPEPVKPKLDEPVKRLLNNLKTNCSAS